MLPRAMSGSVALQQPESMLMSLAPVTTKSRVNDSGVISQLRPCYHQGHTDLGGRCCHGSMVVSRQELLLRAMSESVVLLHLGSVVMIMASFITRVHMNHAC